MSKGIKFYLVIVTPVALLYVLSSALDISGLRELFLVSGLLAAVYLTGQFFAQLKESEHYKRLNEATNNTGSVYSIDDCKETAKDWAKRNYSSQIKKKKGMSFEWTQASSDLAPVYDFTSEEWIYVRYFYTNYGPKNKGTLIFIDATNNEFMTSKPVHEQDLKDRPFEHLEMYCMTREMQGRIGVTGNEQNHNVVYKVDGIPPKSNSSKNSTAEG